MKLIPTTIDIASLPTQLQEYANGANVYNSSCSPFAHVYFIDKDGGYFLKIAKKDSLHSEAVMMAYFHKKGLSGRVYESITDATRDYLLTERIAGFDGTEHKYLENPEKLCDVFAESLWRLHESDNSDCPKIGIGRTESFLADVERARMLDTIDSDLLEYIGLQDKNEAYHLLENQKYLLRDDALIHGDYCLPNILLDDFKFGGFIDVGLGGIGDRHYDLFWGIWTLLFNLHTDEFKDRFLDCYGRDHIDLNRLKLCGIISALT
ncbi:MAG: aminoglycoside 3'-phosphotransferase [Clostridiales Family XIII bacterium]|jgi:kanamycin kinase|nr:aminoglycoside 3'-phosphotransferase [Clostridiales Family XIII bacterium]